MNGLAITIWILPFRHHSSLEVFRIWTFVRPKRQATVFVNNRHFESSKLSEKLGSAREVAVQ